MNLQQLRIIKEVARQNFNLTDVSSALFTSQSGVSKHIRDFEDELGVEIFQRKGKRLLGFTDPGKELLGLVERVLLDLKNIRALADRYQETDSGQLTIATTHTQARYILPEVISKFTKAFPKVNLVLHQASPNEITSLLLDGVVDIGIATESLTNIDEFSIFPFYEWSHIVVVPRQHPLAKESKITFERLSEFPIVTYHEGFTGRKKIDEIFTNRGISLNVAMSALDADVLKTYIDLGLGVGIIASMAYQTDRDIGLVEVETVEPFKKNTTYIALRRGRFLKSFVYRFLEIASPILSESTVKEVILPNGD